MDLRTLSDLRPQFALLASPPFDLHAVCIVAASKDLRKRRSAIQERDNFAGSEQFGTSDGRFVEIILCGIPGDAMRFAPIAKKAEHCLEDGSGPWLWNVFNLAWEDKDRSLLWADRFQNGRLLTESAFPYYESVLPVDVAQSSVHMIDFLLSTPRSQIHNSPNSGRRSRPMSLRQFATALRMGDYRTFKKHAEASWDLQPYTDSPQLFTVDYDKINPADERRIEQHATYLQEDHEKKAAARLAK